MPELPPGFEVEQPKDVCDACKRVVQKWYCEACDEYAYACGCRSHRDEPHHKAIMKARRRPF